MSVGWNVLNWVLCLFNMKVLATSPIQYNTAKLDGRLLGWESSFKYKCYDIVWDKEKKSNEKIVLTYVLNDS